MNPALNTPSQFQSQQCLVNTNALALLARRVFPASSSLSIEPASTGRLVAVYRVHVDNSVFYLRVAEELGQDLSTDGFVLDRLAGLGVGVPAVVHVEAEPQELDRSVLIVAELAGQSLARKGTDEEADRAARAAGGDAAVVNTLAVDGFGWLHRDGQPALSAGLADSSDYSGFVVSQLPDPWPGWLTTVFAPVELDVLEALVESERREPVVQAHLVHGDLDVTHIYVDHGHYSGLIDFGEMRGAERELDLGHFLLHDGETRPRLLFESFLAGYREVSSLPDDHRERIRRSAILSGLRQLSLWLGPTRNASPTGQPVRSRVAQLLNLLEDRPAAEPR